MECERKQSILRAIEELPASKKSTRDRKQNFPMNRTKYIRRSENEGKKLGIK